MDLYFWLQALVMALVGLILVFTFIGRIIGVDGSSMMPTPVSYTHLDVYKRQDGDGDGVGETDGVGAGVGEAWVMGLSLSLIHI